IILENSTIRKICKQAQCLFHAPMGHERSYVVAPDFGGAAKIESDRHDRVPTGSQFQSAKILGTCRSVPEIMIEIAAAKIQAPCKALPSQNQRFGYSRLKLLIPPIALWQERDHPLNG